MMSALPGPFNVKLSNVALLNVPSESQGVSVPASVITMLAAGAVSGMPTTNNGS